ncbi:hypothetical protein ANO14919_115150 [Xylariales sp. No.14919]|nr:hypothetical protein ANO14919_115150 [Xylariales sp. No.14919]
MPLRIQLQLSSIIAVHGLNPRSKSDSEHAWDTWQAPGPEGRLWLRDELPHHIPHSRVLLYQYNSTAVYGKDQSTFVDKANAFLESIRLKRRGYEQRPLLLLGHSLGGLLIKQALINAFNNEKYEKVRLATKGLAFFATPHGGGDKTLVGIGSAAAKIAIGLGFQKGDNILDTLDNGSLFADLMHEHWKQRLLDFDIVSFWGTLDRIVTKESSSFGLPGNRENVVALEADHSGVCKFGNSETDRDNFERVLGNIQDLVENAFKISSRTNERSPKTKTVQKLLRELYTTPYKDLKDRNPERVPGTCEWFTSHDRFKYWREHDNSSLLWVSADPGCGKSVLTKYLVDDVLPSTTTSTTCYFFFKDDFEEQRSVENALRCILCQLFDQRKDLLSDELLEKFETGGAMLLSSFSELWHLLTSVARQKNAGKIICFLDALDECEERGRVRLARALNELYNIESSAFALKFLITSRPYASIQLEFQLLENEKPTIHLQGENQIETDKISREIDVVIKHKVETIGSELRLQSHEATQLYLKLTSIPHRTYLWVYLTFDAIRNSKGFNLEDTIYNLPQTVEEAYERILAKSSDTTTARRLLHIVLAASRPLNLHEMALALDLRLNITPHHANQAAPTDRVRPTIRDLCGLFVIVIDSKVYLLHQTAREFLLGKRLRSHNFRWGGSFQLRESNHILATICVRSLLYITDDPPDNQIHGLFDYAAQNWALHFRNASRRIDTELEVEALQLCCPQSEPCISWVRRYRATTHGDVPISQIIHSRAMPSRATSPTNHPPPSKAVFFNAFGRDY